MARDVVISVLTPDREGLIAGVTQAIYSAGGNIRAMSQTVLQGYFTIIVIATLPDACTPAQLQEAIEATGRAGELLFWSALVPRPFPQPHHCPRVIVLSSQ